MISVNSYWKRPDCSGPWDMHVVRVTPTEIVARDAGGREWRLDSHVFELNYSVEVDPKGNPLRPVKAAVFRPGDVVLLKSGGMKMTVVRPLGDGDVRVSWHNETGDQRTEVYVAACLMPFDPATTDDQ